MNIYQNKTIVKIAIFACAMVIGIVSLHFTSKMAGKMAIEEMRRMQVWAEATRQIAICEDGDEIDFFLRIIQNNNTIPVIMIDEKGEIISTMNLPRIREADTAYCAKRMAIMESKHEPIVITLTPNTWNRIYYDDSIILRQLTYFPYVQMFIMALLALAGYLAFSTSRKAEQNRVWVGMSKETAHQLGTPISSLMAWVEILRQDERNQAYVDEMQKDIDRLRMIADRFSKIGSLPDMQLCDLSKSVEVAVGYMRSRVSSNVNITVVDNTSHGILVNLNAALFNWVIENLIKNAIDAMNGKGSITIKVNELPQSAELLVSDTGKGMHKKQFKAIFTPGYTSKERGWGLGLSLTKRIINEYHKGKISVLSSEIGIGTTFRIILPKGDA